MGCPAERPSALVVEGLPPGISCRCVQNALRYQIMSSWRGGNRDWPALIMGHRQSRSRRHIHRRHHPPLPQPARRPSGDRVIIVGYSQSARIATIAKRPFIETYASETAEPDAPQVDSLARDAGTRKSNEAKTVSAPPDTAPAPDPEPKTKPAAAEKKPKPPAKDADQPKVHGPIEYDSQKTPTESPSSPSGGQAATGDTSATETKSTTTPDSTNSPGSETKDAA